MALRFHKMHGLGNDFVVIDAREQAVTMTVGLARALADRKTGIGCDQLILIEPSAVATAKMRIFNADGGEVESCGNATRCVVSLLGGEATVETLGGLLDGRMIGGTVSVDLIEPRFDWDAIPLAYAMDTARMPLGWDDLTDPVGVNVGNPHVVFFVDDVDAVPLNILGPQIESDPLFPARINVNIAQVVGPNHLKMRTFERGVGLTRACGTGACATGVAAIRRGLMKGPVTIDMPGGTLVIDWAPGRPVNMAGPATHVFTAEADLATFQ
ncbi:diaminopimelate epimerase [Sphingomonas montanisoli]|uniref:Diaminopimelate epimerase n=1 Tax=Sphingomonas montanisoli TaxID=2606412 RepID=A0A5D9C7T7_9SPHN|nr:diaminopimelate epimerase [Sphingomonas montanisoli]TZG27473.1 diaminopimelate epimerase [Sphingomonas montanisoli]